MTADLVEDIRFLVSQIFLSKLDGAVQRWAAVKNVLFRLLPVLPFMLVSGCILLPIPNEQWLTPRIHGTVQDFDTGRPLESVKVTLQACDADEGASKVAYTDSNGGFSILLTRHSSWLPLWLAPAEHILCGTIEFDQEGYERVTTEKETFGPSRTDLEVTIHLKRKGAEPHRPNVAKPPQESGRQ